MERLFDITNKTAIVAGAGGGIGAAISALLFRSGANLVLLDKDAAKLAQVGAALDVEPLTQVGDIVSKDDCDRVMERAFAAYGSVDIVVNAAGILPIASAEDTTAQLFRECIENNLTGALLLSQSGAAVMGNEGSILHIASVSSHVANINYAAYASSKSALSQLVRVLAREWANRGIRVNALGPALIETPLTGKYLSSPDFRKAAVNAIPMGRLGTTDDLLAPVLMLCAPGGRFITGQTLFVDGGRTLV